MTPATDFSRINQRLAALQLPVLNADATRTFSVASIEHALGCAEKGDAGAKRFLAKHLATAAPSPARTASPAATTTRQTAPPPATAGNAQSPIPEARSSTRAAPVAPPPPPPAPVSVAEPAEDRHRADSSTAPPTTSGPLDRVQCRIYGSKAALCIESDETRQGEPTLRIEAAPATAPRQYDWAQKRVIQLTREELPIVAATVLGLLPRCEYKSHGPEKDKGLEILHQGTHLFVRLFQKERGVVAVQVTAADCYALGALCLRQLRRTAPWLDAEGVLLLLKTTVQRMAVAAASAKNSP